MSQLQRHKFTVQRNGLSSKTSLMLVLHKVKPLIYKRYVSLLIKKDVMNDPKDCNIRVEGTIYQVKKDLEPGEIETQINPFKYFVWEGRVKSAATKRLPIVKRVKQKTTFAKSSRELIENLNKLIEQPIQTFEDLKLNPVRRFQSQYRSPANHGDPIGNRYFIGFKNLTIPSNFVVIVPGPTYGNRVEIDLIDNPRAMELINLHIYLFELQRELDQNYIWRPLEPELQPSDDEFVGSKLTNSNKSFSVSKNCMSLGHQLARVQRSKKMFIFVFTYFVLFFLIGFFSALLA